MDSSRNIRLEKLTSAICTIAVYVFFIADGFNKYLQVNTGISGQGNIYHDSGSVSVYVRLLFELLCVGMIFRQLNTNTLNFLMLILFFVLLVFVGNLSFVYFNRYDYDWMYHLKLLNKYLFVFIIYLAILPLKSSSILDKPLKAFRNIIFINSCLIILGLIFDIVYFKSYHTATDRFGFNGLSPSLNETSLFYIIAISYLYLIKNESVKNRYIFVFVVFSSLFIGAKGVYLYLIFLFFYHLIYHTSTLVKVPIFAGFICGFGFLIYKIMTEYRFLIEKFVYIYNERGFLSMLLSERDMLFDVRFYKNVEMWDITNYLFGGYDQLKFLIELDFVDIFLFFGIVGSIIYIAMYFCSLFLFSRWLPFIFFFVFVYFFQAALSGHFFYSATNSLYLVLFSFYLKNLARKDLDFSSKKSVLPS